MKKIVYFIGLSFFGYMTHAQILTSTIPAAGVPQSNAFFDASTAHSSIAGENNNKHKGLVFPDVDLTLFQFENVIADGATFPSYYDGMIVYNSATGTTLTTGINPSTSTSVTPGFYYFSNPNGAANGNVTSGIWKPLGGNVESKDITTTEVVLDRKINGQQLYAIKGDFTASGSSALISVPVPSGMTGYYSFVVYKDGMTFRNSIVSFNTATSTNNVTTGYSMFTEAYPAGNYSYVLEYFK
jgi:hypothetical protein